MVVKDQFTGNAEAISAPARGRRIYFLLGILFSLLVAVLVGLGSYAYSLYRNRDLLVFSYRLDLSRIMQGDPDTFWSLRPNLQHELFQAGPEAPNSFHVTTNNLGLRNPPVAAKGDRFRILAIGDSTTFGEYVEDDEAWPAQLQTQLDPDARRVEVINAGLIGATSFQGLCYLIKRGFALEPDVVIATYGFNDGGKWNLSDRVNLSPQTSPGLTSFLLPWLWKWDRGHEAKLENKPRVLPGEFLDVLMTMADLCKEHGITLYYLLWPSATQVTGPYDAIPGGPWATYQSLVLEAASRAEVTVIDPRKAFHDGPQPVLLDGVHASPAGCRIAAQTVAETIHKNHPTMFATAEIVPSH